MSIACVLCRAHPADGTMVSRINPPLGQRGVWACEACYGEATHLWQRGKIAADGTVRP